MDDSSDRSESRAPELEDLTTLCAALNREKAGYVLIGGFAVILHGWVRTTKDIDLLVDPSEGNVRRLKRAMAVLPDNAIALMADDELERYQVVRVADEVVVDLLATASGVRYQDLTSADIIPIEVLGVSIPVASKRLLIRTKQTVRASDAADVRFLRFRDADDPG